jgi:RNA polymerase sigma factor (sigma-70 family)
VTPPPDFTPLVARAQLGDRAALEEVLRALQRPLYEHLRTIVGDPQTAEDVLQDTLFTVARKLHTLRDPRWLRAWAYRIATRNGVRRAMSEQRWADEPTEQELSSVIEEPSVPLDAESLERLRSAVSAVPPASQLVLRMHYLDGLSYAEVAEALDISVGTVKSRLAYGRQALRMILRGE